MGGIGSTLYKRLQFSPAWHTQTPDDLYDVRLGSLAARVNHFKYADFMKVYEAATSAEKKQLDPIRLRKRADPLKKGKRADVVTAEAQ